ncbi:DUF2169 domain-containing protein [Allopusillimonas ginsengisoli]|uniref:DUF2169 family type VI secretion system accessory protein n=1 Tax=Allopusillimonas ginsengisoli TaxID=453575 RepID=UPI0039C169DE
MHIHKPDDTLLLLGYGCQAGQPALTATVGYICGMDGVRVPESEAWKWLVSLFPDEPFDLGEKKARGGFGVAGDACAQAGTQVDGLTVRAGVGSLEGRVLVQGDRHWTSTATGWRATISQPFERTPIGLAHAYGGAEWRDNPFGRGYASGRTVYEGMPLPNVERPDQPILKPSDTPATATLGAQPQGSAARDRWLGTMDRVWASQRLPWLPDDTDDRWYDRFDSEQCQSAYWRGDEPWFAENMHPQHSLMQGKLPGLRPRLLMRTVARPDHHAELHLELDTVWLMPNDERVIVLYRAQTAVLREDAKDVLGLAVFTENLADTPQPLTYWSHNWTQALEPTHTAPVPVPAPLNSETLAQLQTDGEQAEQEAAAFQASLEQEVDQEFKTAEAEVEAHLRAQGLDLKTLKAQAAQADTGGLQPPDLSPLDLPSEPHAYEAALRAHIDGEFTQAEAEVRNFVEKQGLDLDALKAQAAANPSMPDDTAAFAQLIGLLPGPESKRQASIQEFTQFQQEMDGLETTLQSEFKQAEQEAAAKAAQAGAYAEPKIHLNGLPEGPRERLTRDALLGRAQAGASTAWTELQDLDLSGQNLGGLDLRGSILRGCNLQGALLVKADLADALLEHCKLGAADLQSISFTQAQLDSCDMQGAQLAKADFSLARITTCIFDKADLTGSSWDGAQAQDCSFETVQLKQATGPRAQFTQCRMPCADATASRFEKAEFEQCTLDGAIFNRAQLSGATLLACQASHAQFDGANLQGLRTMQKTQLDKANLHGADLRDASLQNTSLVQAVLREAQLDRALVKECDLSGTDAWRMVARAADFTDSKINGSSWRGVNLMQSILREASLLDTDLTGANLHDTQTRTASVQGLQLEGALLTRCRLLQEYDRA